MPLLWACSEELLLALLLALLLGQCLSSRHFCLEQTTTAAIWGFIMAVIRISRPKESACWLNPYRLFVDGTFTVEILRESSVEIPLSMGRHTLQAWINWCSSSLLNIDIPEREEVVEFEVSSNLSGWRLWTPGLCLLYITVWSSDFLQLRKV
jgi:hypothetical protein